MDGVVERPLHVGEVGGARGSVGRESAQAAADALAGGVVVIADRRAEPARAAVRHDPQAIVLVGLQLDEVIAAAERAELQAGAAAAQGLERGRG